MNGAWQSRTRSGFPATVFLCVALMLAAAARAADAPAAAPADPAAAGNGGGNATNSLLNMDLDQLSKADVKVPSMDVEVTSVMKEQSTVGRSPAAVFVITQDMIRRSGATNIPEALRMAPGVDVARISTNSWAISIRGFNSINSNKLLVLIDGRSIYNEISSGVLWNEQDVMLEDVERIEVVRGPGGTLWGANAVNGVINIISKSAKDTQGGLVSAGGGYQDKWIGAGRYGGHSGDDFFWRVYGKDFDIAPGNLPDGIAHDQWRQGRGGFRMDWFPDHTKADTLTLQGDFYQSASGESGVRPTPTYPYGTFFDEDVRGSGANLLGRWTHVVDERQDWSLLAYYDQYMENQYISSANTNIFDIEFQDRFPIGQRSEIVWGLSYRYCADNLHGDGFDFAFSPEQRSLSLPSAFVQDQISLVKDRLALILGTKFEHNDYTGFEVEPSGRLLWTPDPKQSMWAAVSRAVRTPDRFEANGLVTMGPVGTATVPPGIPLPVFVQTLGNPLYGSEYLTAYETGYRRQVTDRFAWDLALFYNEYDSLRTSSPGPVVPGPGFASLIETRPFTNWGQGYGYGAEIAVQWSVNDRWRLSGAYSWLETSVWVSQNGTPGSGVTPSQSPNNQVYLRSSWDLTKKLDFDLAARYVDGFEIANAQTNLFVSPYVTMDAQIVWKARQNLELALIGQNLTANNHYEFGPEYYVYATRVPTSVFGKLTWRF